MFSPYDGLQVRGGEDGDPTWQALDGLFGSAPNSTRYHSASGFRDINIHKELVDYYSHLADPSWRLDAHYASQIHGHILLSPKAMHRVSKMIGLDVEYGGIVPRS